MPKLKLLILDAGVVIYLHELGLWSKVVASCDLYLSRIVAEKEVLFQKSEQDEYGYDIDFSNLITAGAITAFDVSGSDLKTFRNQFDLLYLGDLDDGETESLAYLVGQSPEFLISSGDAIVFRVLGNLNRGEQRIFRCPFRCVGVSDECRTGAEKRLAVDRRTSTATCTPHTLLP